LSNLFSPSAQADVLINYNFKVVYFSCRKAGLEYLKRPVVVYAHTELFKDSYSTRTDQLSHSGVPFKREVLESKGARFDLSTEFRSIAPGLFMTGQVPRVTAYEKGAPHQVIRELQGLVQDPLV
jgi:7,8-dihydropterin-6-yl-methyl-4-(beta-D-ribofuranosyl)aminobenzene 5'-phosphate synthase